MRTPSKIHVATLAAAALLLVFSSYSTVRASVLTSNLFPLPFINQLSDDSLEVVYESDGTTVATTLAQGDILQGQITFHAIQKSGDSGSAIALNVGMQVTAIFSAVVGPITDTGIPGPSRYAFNLSPNSTFESTFGTGAMAVLFENDGSNPYNTRSAGTFSDYFTDAQSGTKMATIGFTGAGGTATGGEGWLSQVGSLSTVPQTNQFSLGSFTANLNLFDGASYGVFNDPTAYNFLFSQGSFFGTFASTQFLVNGQLFTRASGSVSANDGSGNPFPVGDNSSAFFQVQAVPEPVSCMIWTVILGCSAACARRTRIRS